MVSRDFTPKRIREMEARIREVTARLLGAVQRKGKFELMADLANPLPVMAPGGSESGKPGDCLGGMNGDCGALAR
jgi:hypothetical protein